MKPILKYRGGKSKEIPAYKDLIPKFETYYEPFFGGGATFFYIEPKEAVIGDINHSLIRFYEDISSTKFFTIKEELHEIQVQYQINRQRFIKDKKRFTNQHVDDPNDALYYSLRDMFNGKKRSEYEWGSIYYFINKTAYSGMIRYNSSGDFNVPYGRYANFNTSLLTEEHHNLLSTVQIQNSSYELLFEQAGTKDFMFLDPPYDTIFSEYGNDVFTGDFKEEEHRKLAEDFKNLSASALMIIGETPLTLDLYKGYIKDKYPKNYSVNIRNRFKSSSNHLVVTNY